MATTHRPDFEAFRLESPQAREAGTRFREAYLWPYINQEDLLKPKILLLFLKSRSRNQPDAFAAADMEATHLGRVANAIMPPFLNHYTMYFHGRNTAASYGELVAWDDDDSAFEDMSSRRAMQPGEGLEILEIQERTLRFLIDCCVDVMHDVPREELTSDKFPTQKEPAYTPDTVAGFASLAVMAAEAPYRVPFGLDLSRLESLIQASLLSAEDHIWALREDPSYFSDCLKEYKEHRQELMKDSKGQSHPLFRHRRDEVFWGRVIGNVIVSAYLSLEIWSELLAQVRHLHHLQSKYASKISPAKNLPDEYLSALLRFQHYLTQASKGPLNELKHGVVASPAFRSYFARVPSEDPTTTGIKVMSKPGIKLDKVEGQLMWLLRTLWEDGDQLFFAGLTNVVDELERLVQAEPKAKHMMSAHIADVLANLSIVTQALRQINIYQPWAQTFEWHMVDKKEDIEKEFATRTQPWAGLMKATDGPRQATIARLGEPSEKRFHYLVDKRRTQENVQAMRDAEDNLDKFWAEVDRNLEAQAGKLENTALRKLLAQPRVLQRTPEWVEPVKPAKEQDARREAEVIRKPLSELYFDLERRTESTVDRSSMGRVAAAKAKTRGVPQPMGQSDDLGSEPAPSALADEQPTFALDQRALKVFRTIFFTPSATAMPGEVPWLDFLHAMSSTGFVPEKLYGSVWQFSPTNLDVERSIQFHEPHPSGKIPYRTARRHGRRLNRAYGWTGDNFILAERAITARG